MLLAQHSYVYSLFKVQVLTHFQFHLFCRDCTSDTSLNDSCFQIVAGCWFRLNLVRNSVEYYSRREKLCGNRSVAVATWQLRRVERTLSRLYSRCIIRESLYKGFKRWNFAISAYICICCYTSKCVIFTYLSV